MAAIDSTFVFLLPRMIQVLLWFFPLPNNQFKYCARWLAASWYVWDHMLCLRSQHTSMKSRGINKINLPSNHLKQPCVSKGSGGCSESILASIQPSTLAHEMDGNSFQNSHTGLVKDKVVFMSWREMLCGNFGKHFVWMPYSSQSVPLKAQVSLWDKAVCLLGYSCIHWRCQTHAGKPWWFLNGKSFWWKDLALVNSSKWLHWNI